MNKLGIYFGTEKQEALLRGDSSNAVVNRHFVYGFQAFGMFFCKTPGASPSLVLMQARYAQRFWETLIEIYKVDNRRLMAQAEIGRAHV